MCRESIPGWLEEGRAPDVADLLMEVSLLLGSARFYGPAHAKCLEMRDRTHKTLKTLQEAQPGHPLEIGLADGYLFHEERPLRETDRGADRARRLLEEAGAGGIVFGPETTEQDLGALVELAQTKDVGDMTLEAANAVLAANGARGLRLLGAYAVGDGPADHASRKLGTKVKRETPASGAGVISVPVRLYDHLFDYLTDTMTGLFSDKLFLLEDTKHEVALMLRELTDDAYPLMNATAKRTSRADPYLFRHSIRVACVALNVARTLTENPDVLLSIGAAALLHDIGKRYVPLDVLYHDGPLDDAQREIMEEHPRHGARLLMQLEDSDPLTVAACFGHHWQTDQRGYPDVEYRARQSVATRLIKLCDVYEALTAKRPYKPSMAPRRAYRIMMQMEGHFDRALLHRFVLANGVWPSGHRVRLESGALARVQEQTGELDRPRVRLDGEEELLDLREAQHHHHGVVVDFAPQEDDGDEAEQAVASAQDAG